MGRSNRGGAVAVQLGRGGPHTAGCLRQGAALSLTELTEAGRGDAITRLRVLIVSYRFPPYNSIGAVRVGKTAKFLARFGHDVRVLTARDQPLDPSLEVEIAPGHVHATPWLNVNAPAELASGGRQRVREHGFARQGRGAVIRRLGGLYRSVVNLPDGQVGWYPFAVRAGTRLLRGWRPDLIFASAMPFTSLLVARRLSRRFGVPWVAEMRDLWDYGDPAPGTAWRRPLEARLERRTLGSARALVTVSEPLAETLRGRYGKPVQVVLNGYDEEDRPAQVAPRDPRAPLEIVYTGMVYEGKRDPSPLFAAIRDLGERGRRVRVSFYGRYLDVVRGLAERHGVADRVALHGSVPYREALRIQAAADALLLLLWNDPRERGVFTGKFFEYLAARRPILAIGPDDNVAACTIRARGAGEVAGEAGEVRRVLEGWLDRLDRDGALPPLADAVAAGFTREEQARVLERFLASTLRGKEGAP